MISNFKEADRISKKLERILDKDLHLHGCRNAGDTITQHLEYCDVRDIIQAYNIFRAHQIKMRTLLKAICSAGREVKIYDMDVI